MLRSNLTDVDRVFSEANRGEMTKLPDSNILVVAGCIREPLIAASQYFLRIVGINVKKTA
jgi:hypothetical protein